MVVALPLEIWHRILQSAVYVPHHLEDALESSPLVERGGGDVMSTTVAGTKTVLSRLSVVNTTFRALASELKYQHLIFRNPSDLQVLVHAINTSPRIHAGLRKNARTITVLFSLGRDRASYEVHLGRLTTVLLLTPDLTVIELCESRTHEWRSVARANAIEYWLVQVASLAPNVKVVKFGLDWSNLAPSHVADWTFLSAVAGRYMHLRYLHCNFACNESSIPFRPPFQPLVLPNLERLVTCIAELRYREEKVEHLEEWIEQWRMPALTHMKITGMIAHHDWGWIIKLLTNNGGHMETFILEQGTRRTHAPGRFWALCPKIQLVMAGEFHIPRPKQGTESYL